MKFVIKSKKILVVFLLLIVGVLFVSMPVLKDVFGHGGNNNGIFIEVAQGETLRGTAKKLYDNGIISYEKVFYFYAKGKAADFKFGGHVFTTSMSYSEICEQLSTPGTAKTVKLTIPEGYELRLIAQACEDAGIVTAKEFMDSAVNDVFDYKFLKDKAGVNYKLEGFLFPATYEFNYGVSAYEVIDKLLETFDNVYTEKYSARAKELGMSDYDIITLASVIEREAADASEHKKVAGVFYNRIKGGMNLQSCATVQYVLKERKPVLSIKDTEIDSPYNTYKYSGLPVGPVASPSKSAIEAALYPESHDYYYFVAKADGKGHVFSKTFSEHNKAVAENQ